MNSNSGVADINKVNASDLNEIKSTINGVDGGTDILTNLFVGSVHTKNLFDSSTIFPGDITGATPTLRLCSRQALWLEAGTYTFSTNKSSTYRFVLQVQSTGVPPLSSYPTFIYDSGWNTGTSKTFTISSSGYFNLLLSRSDNTAFSTSDISTLKGYNYQLEKGSSSSTYTPYQNLSPSAPLTKFYTAWSTSITFEMPIGKQGLVLDGYGGVLLLWNPNDQIHGATLLGTLSTYTITRDNSKTIATVSKSSNTTWTVLVF